MSDPSLLIGSGPKELSSRQKRKEVLLARWISVKPALRWIAFWVIFALALSWVGDIINWHG